MAARSSRTEQVREATSMRLDVKLREAVAISASENNRTLASEIEHRLRQSFAAQSDLRSVIREEIRAALAERDEAQPDADGFVPFMPRSGFLYRY